VFFEKKGLFPFDFVIFALSFRDHLITLFVFFSGPSLLARASRVLRFVFRIGVCRTGVRVWRWRCWIEVEFGGGDF
jgi:hypothetical protein